MAVHENLTTFYGLPVADWSPAEAETFDYAGHVPRLRLDDEEAGKEQSIAGRLEVLLVRPETPDLKALVFGQWGVHATSADVVETLFAHRLRVAGLEALFLGDITAKESRISRIKQSDISPLWQACPNLRELVLRGGNDLVIGAAELPKLEKLVIQAGGLSRKVIQDVFTSSLPSLRHLELWLGATDFGGDTKAEDFEGLILAHFPALRSLGLCDCEYADDLAGVIAKAPVLARLARLDLSLGTLGDDGAEALLASSTAARLEELDLHYHFISPDVAEKLKSFGPAVNLDDPQAEDDHDRHVAVSE